MLLVVRTDVQKVEHTDFCCRPLFADPGIPRFPGQSESGWIRNYGALALELARVLDAHLPGWRDRTVGVDGELRTYDETVAQRHRHLYVVEYDAVLYEHVVQFIPEVTPAGHEVVLRGGRWGFWPEPRWSRWWRARR